VYTVFFIVIFLFIIVVGILIVTSIIRASGKISTTTTQQYKDKHDDDPPIPKGGLICPRCGASLKVDSLSRKGDKWYGHCSYCDSDFGL
jgi:hypothetical protein